MISRRFAALLGRALLGLMCAVGVGFGQALPDAGHWAFEPVREPVLPQRIDPSQRSEVDVHLGVAEELPRDSQPDVQRDLRSDLAWLRRLTFDLTGLPPTPEEIEAFLAGDRDEGARLKVVDRLLASPRFGERFGRHWLDVARFAESSGGGRSLMYPNAWRYRDYVIDAYNRDLPFDQFVTEQIAGDLMESAGGESAGEESAGERERNRRMTATGFLVLGPHNYEQQDKKLLQFDVIDEQVDTIFRAFTGLTMGCARCHDHKFDPLSMRDYYAVSGILESSVSLVPGNVSAPVERILEGPAARAREAFEREVQELERKRRVLKSKLPAKENVAVPRERLRGLVLDEGDVILEGMWKLSTAIQPFLGAGYLHDEDVDKGMKSALFQPDVPRAGRYEIRLAYTPGTNRATNVPILVDTQNVQEKCTVDQRQDPPLLGRFVSLGVFELKKGLETTVRIETQGTDGHVIVDGLQLVPVPDLPKKAKRAGPPLAHVARELRALEVEIEERRKRAPRKPPRVIAVEERDPPVDSRLRLRGLVHKPGEVVARGVPEAFGKVAMPAGQSGRLELARWLASDRHPLTARVYVNRIYGHLMGHLLVSTPDNFGTRGARPSSPELLDHLASAFVQHDWSTKWLVRELVTSRAYATQRTARRLQAEELRDAILSASLELDLAAGGPTIRKVARYDRGYVFKTRRRSVYVPFFRNAMLQLFEVFDISNPNLVTGKRNVSQVAPQALYLLNSDWVRDRAREGAKRLLASVPARDRLEVAFLSYLGRPALREERELFEDALVGVGRDRLEDAWAELLHALIASLDFRYLK